MDHVIFVVSPHQMSPLHWAIDKGHLNTMKCLLKKGADVNSKNNAWVSEWDSTAVC